MDKPTDLLGDVIRDAIAIDVDHAEQCDAFDAAASARALLADRERWNRYVRLAAKLGFGTEAEAVVFCAAATPAPRKGPKAADPIRAAIFAAAEAEGCGPYADMHGTAGVVRAAQDPTNSSLYDCVAVHDADGHVGYDVAAGLARHRAGFSVPRTKAAGPAVGKVAAARTLREHSQKLRAAREAGQGFFTGLAFRAPSESDDDLIPEGA